MSRCEVRARAVGYSDGPRFRCLRDAGHEDMHDFDFSSPEPTVGVWQPIETAPMDGTWILVYCDKSAWPESRCLVVAWTPQNHRAGMYGWRDTSDEYFHKPSHWMPLPPPP